VLISLAAFLGWAYDGCCKLTFPDTLGATLLSGKMTATDSSDLQSWCEVPSIAHFCSLFRYSNHLGHCSCFERGYPYAIGIAIYIFLSPNLSGLGYFMGEIVSQTEVEVAFCFYARSRVPIKSYVHRMLCRMQITHFMPSFKVPA
jgi:hypothetical protein